MQPAQTPQSKKAIFLIAAFFLVLTVGIAAVCWYFISSLEENSAKLRQAKIAMETVPPHEHLMEPFTNPIDKVVKPLGSSYEANNHQKSTELYENAKRALFDHHDEAALTLTESSIEELEKEIGSAEKTPDDVKALCSRYSFAGKLYQNKKEYEKALSYFTKAIELNPNIPYNYNRRADVFHELNDDLLSAKDRTHAQELEGKMDKTERAISRLMGDGLED